MTESYGVADYYTVELATHDTSFRTLTQAIAYVERFPYGEIYRIPGNGGAPVFAYLHDTITNGEYTSFDRDLAA